MTPRVTLVVQHEEPSPAARLGTLLRERGLALDVRRPFAGEPLPEPPEVGGYAAVVVLGGAVDSWDDVAAPWLPATRRIVVAAEATGVPTLGVCLGHQVAAAALGGEVARNPGGTTVAVLPVGWTPAAADDPLVAGVGPVHGVHWNNDVVLRPPPGTVVLARSPDGHLQAARLGEHVWGVQYHPEADPALVASWARDDGSVLAAAGVDADGYAADAARLAADLEQGCRGLADGLAALARRRAPGIPEGVLR